MKFHFDYVLRSQKEKVFVGHTEYHRSEYQSIIVAVVSNNKIF